MTEAPALTVGRRERTRAATVAEIKATALRLMREQGTTNLRFSDVAREMGMTAPALYRYFADREALLTALIVDAWSDLATTLAAASDPSGAADLDREILAIAAAYRAWACADPSRFTLIYGLPIPGYELGDEESTRDAAERGRDGLERLVRAAIVRGVARTPATGVVDGHLVALLVEQGRRAEPPIPAEYFQGILQAWMVIHGFVCLEIYGHLGDFPEDAHDALFAAQVRLAALAMGLP
jgi:AcrR family transcriptional regulator